MFRIRGLLYLRGGMLFVFKIVFFFIRDWMVYRGKFSSVFLNIKGIINFEYKILSYFWRV